MSDDEQFERSLEFGRTARDLKAALERGDDEAVAALEAKGRQLADADRRAIRAALHRIADGGRGAEGGSCSYCGEPVDFFYMGSAVIEVDALVGVSVIHSECFVKGEAG